MSFSKRLKMLRKQHKMTQQQVADELCVARTTITGYETKSRQPSHEKLAALADLFNVSIDYLLYPKETETLTESAAMDEEELFEKIQIECRNLSCASKERALEYILYLKFCESK